MIAKNAGWFLPHEKICWVSERHTRVSKDIDGRLHNETGPSIAYPDGWSLYYWHGVSVTQQIVEAPETITVEQIEKEANAEVRRVMIERYGQARYLSDSGAVAIHQDDWGTLYKKEITNDEPLVMVKVVNSTAEPDGHFKDYFIRVPPDTTTAHAAVAWTFDLTEQTYAPAMMT